MYDVKEIISLISSPSKEGVELITEAHKFAERAHAGQKRHSGNDYFLHLHETAKNLALYGMKREVVAAGLLHDSIEDGVATEEEIRKKFGEEILFLIQGVTKLGALKYKGTKRHAESLRKLFIATSKDARVLMIKLTDRLHNMQTLQYVPKEKQIRIALETAEIYAPLAYRLGITKLSRELEDLAFKFLEPEEYERISKIIKERTKKDTAYLEKISRTLKKEMAKNKTRVLNTNYRIKGVKSLHKKLLKRGVDSEVHDILALRIIVSTIDDCYQTLGIVHGLWRPAPGRIKDYIALPKENGYRSLQTTVFTGNGNLIEIQIRTEEMHREAEYGIAAHAKYKGESLYSGLWLEKFIRGIKIDDNEVKIDTPNIVRHLSTYDENYKDPANFVKELTNDFFGERIFILTPDGDAVDLPEGSGPIDFAYSIHSDIGDHISGVKINGKMASLGALLKNGDIIEILTKKSLSPTQKWLSLAKTNSAKRHIRGVLEKIEKSIL